jgi:uncharacterized paraquat-inducible protein A
VSETVLPGADLTAPAEVAPKDKQYVCPHCKTILRLPEPDPGHKSGYSCPNCGETLPSAERARRARHWQLIWAFLGLAWLIPGFIQPMIIIDQPDVRIEAGFLESLQKLWDYGDKLIAVVVGIASGVMAVAKLILLIVLGCGFQFDPHKHRWLHKALEFTGSWSMTEIQLVSMGLFWWRGSVLDALSAGPGISYFIGMIFVTKIATMAYRRVVDWRHFHGS